MAYNSIDSADIAVGKPVTNGLMTTIKDNLDYLYGLSDPGYSGVLNGSFEIDSDADGIPDGWTRTLYTGGAGAREDGATNQDFGRYSYKFTHPGGATNGGGQLTSEYIEISESVSPIVEFTWYGNSACKSEVKVEYFRAAKTSISTETLWTNVAASSPAAFARVVKFGLPPGEARFMKIIICGGVVDATYNAAGMVYFDNIRCNPLPVEINGDDFTITEATTSSSSYATLGTANIRIPKGFTTAFIPAEMYVTPGDAITSETSGWVKYLINAANSSNELQQRVWISSDLSGVVSDLDDWRCHNYGVLEVSVAGISGASVACALQAKGSSLTGHSPYVGGAKVAGSIRFVRK